MTTDSLGPPARRRVVRDIAGLEAAGLIDPAEREQLNAVAARFAVSITPAILDRIADGAADPLVKQFVPSTQELDFTPDEMEDPIGDETHTPVPGVTHRYRDRVLLKPLHVCPVYCRFCFRREVVGPGNGFLGHDQLDVALGYIRDHEEIWEVILTGGDPLLLSPTRLRHIMRALDAIPHVRVIRIHTRVPVVAPERITAEVLEVLHGRNPVWVVLHCNHACELGEAARSALSMLADSGIPLLSQTVLLKGINDTAEAVERLLRSLVELRVKPYYLHQSDLASGTSHLRTTISTGQDIVQALRGPVSGLCQPIYVLDIPGGYGKVPIARGYLSEDEHGYVVTDPTGRTHRYAPTTTLPLATSPHAVRGQP